MQRQTLTLCGIVLSLGLGVAANAQNLPERIVAAEVLPGWREANGTHVAALRLTLAPGWKTYWRVPGEAGIPPVFNWRGSRNVTGVNVTWPTPRVFDQAGTQSIGYTDQVILPLTLSLRQAISGAKLKGKVQIGVCKDVCIPETLTITADIPTGGKRQPEIVAALIDRPFTAKDAGVSSASCRIAPIEGGLSIEAVIKMPSAGAPEAVVIEPADPQLYVTQAHTNRNGGTLTAKAKVYHVDGGAFSLSRATTRITVIGGSYAVDIAGCSGS